MTDCAVKMADFWPPYEPAMEDFYPPNFRFTQPGIVEGPADFMPIFKTRVDRMMDGWDAAIEVAQITSICLGFLSIATTGATFPPKVQDALDQIGGYDAK